MSYLTQRLFNHFSFVYCHVFLVVHLVYVCTLEISMHIVTTTYMRGPYKIHVCHIEVH